MELYYATGPEIVSYLKGLGHSVFWISSFMTFPNTVKSAMKVLSQLGVDMTFMADLTVLGISCSLRSKRHCAPSLSSKTQSQAPLRNKAPSLPLDKGFLLLGKELKIP